MNPHSTVSDPGPAPFGAPSFGLTRTLRGVPFDDVVARARESLATQGFGVLTEIDVRATLGAKLDVDHPPYLILGACNPPLAHQALTALPAIGLLLPCNVVVAQQPDDSVVISAVDPRALLSVVGDDVRASQPQLLSEFAADVAARLGAALDELIS